MTSPHLLNIAVHVTAGTLALAVGLVPIVTVKGGRAHRRTGWWFVAAGAVVVACADLGCLAFPQPGPFVVATLAASYQYVGGLRSTRRFTGTPDDVDGALALSALLIWACWFDSRIIGSAEPE